MADQPRLVIRDLRVRTLSVPMPRPLQTSSGAIRQVPLALIDLHTEEGVTGSTYLFCYTPPALQPVAGLLRELGRQLAGQPLAPFDIERRLQQQFRLLGVKGLVAMAIAGIDMAAWDALARARGLPLARLLGGTPRPVAAYNSCGLGMIGSRDAPAEAERLLDGGFEAVKLRLGYPTLRADLEVVRAVRSAIGDEVRLMVDYNQSLPVAEATRRIAALGGEGLEWVEEPTFADDYEGHAQLRAKSAVPIQMGENWWSPQEMGRCLAAGGSDLVMPDAMKIGGVSGWLRAAALAEAHGLPMSSHLFPEVSAHLLAVTPTAHWLEYVDWASPILQQPLAVEGGRALVDETPGSGIAWNEEAVARYLVD